MKSRGIFIIFEGLDRCGKSTQVSNCLKYFKQKKLPCIELTFPDRSTATGKLLDKYLKKEQMMNDEVVHLLYTANRWEKKYLIFF